MNVIVESINHCTMYKKIIKSTELFTFRNAVSHSLQHEENLVPGQ